MRRKGKVTVSNKRHDMFKHKEGKKTPKRVTINDIFALQEEVKLTAKIMGRNCDSIDRIYKSLKHDLISSSSYGGWNLTLSSFAELTPMLKPHFEQCTIENMGLLLNEFRQEVDKRTGREPNRFLKRNSQPANFYYDEMEPKGRLFPMGKSWYSTRFQFIFYKRFGNEAYRTATFRDHSADYGYISMRIHEGKLKFLGTKEGIEITGENYKKIMRMERDTSGNLQEFFKKETVLKGGGKA
jgi:hypothetical protein